MIPINLLLGFYFRFSTYYFLIDSIRFIFFYVFMIIFAKGIYIKEFVRQITLYVVYYAPFLFTITGLLSGKIVLGEDKNNYFDEFSSFYIISILPFIFLETCKKTKLLLLLVTIVTFSVKATFFYFGSFEILGLVVSILLFTYFSGTFLKFVKRGIIVCSLTFLIGGTVYNFGNNYTRFKMDQAFDAVSFIVTGFDINFLTFVPFSPRVRILEFYNSIYDMKSINNFLPLIGKGYGSSFKMEALPPHHFGINSFFDTGSYSDEEVLRGEYKSGHNTISFLPLKIGFIGLITIFYIVSIGFKICRHSKYKWLLISSIPYILMNIGYGLKNFIIIGSLIGFIIFLKMKTSENQSSIQD